MKKLLLAVSVLASLHCSAADVRISARSTLGALNKFSDWVYFTVSVSKPSGEPSCEPGATSKVIALAPGASISFSDANLPDGIQPAQATEQYYFLSANLLKGLGSCATTAARVGEDCTGLPNSATIVVTKADCAPAGSVHAVWSIDKENTTLIFE